MDNSDFQVSVPTPSTAASSKDSMVLTCDAHHEFLMILSLLPSMSPELQLLGGCKSEIWGFTWHLIFLCSSS